MSYLTTSRFSQQTKLATDDTKTAAETEEVRAGATTARRLTRRVHGLTC